MLFNIPLLSFLEWSGSLTGLLGAALLASNSRFSGWGFICFLLSNIAWGWFGVMTGTHGILVMQVGFTLTSLVGIWRWRASFFQTKRDPILAAQADQI